MTGAFRTGATVLVEAVKRWYRRERQASTKCWESTTRAGRYYPNADDPGVFASCRAVARGVVRSGVGEERPESTAEE